MQCQQFYLQQVMGSTFPWHLRWTQKNGNPPHHVRKWFPWRQRWWLEGRRKNNRQTRVRFQKAGGLTGPSERTMYFSASNKTAFKGCLPLLWWVKVLRITINALYTFKTHFLEFLLFIEAVSFANFNNKYVMMLLWGVVKTMEEQITSEEQTSQQETISIA